MQELKDKAIYQLAYNSNLDEVNFDCTIEQKDFLNQYQGKTSYCWMYSCLALLKEYIYKNDGVCNYDFSYSYLMFFDKYERMKCAIDMIYQGKYEDKDFDKDLKFLSSDKGDFQIFVNLVNKYGLVLESDMPQTFCVKSTYDLNDILHNYLINLIKDRENDNCILKEKACEEVYSLLVDCYGFPPSYVEINNEKISPLKFYNKYLYSYFDNFITIGNCLDKDEYINKCCCYKKRMDFISRNKSKFINLKKQDFINIVVKQLQSSCAYISFKISDANIGLGLFDDKLYDLNKVTGLNVTLDKEYIMRYKDAYPEHALLLVGVDVDDNNILKWKVKDNNDKIGKNGYFILSKTWFEKYVSSVVVSKNLLDSSMVECLHDESINIF